VNRLQNAASAAKDGAGARGLLRPAISRNDVANWLGVSEAGGGGAPADELGRRRPLGDMLVAGGLVITDVRRVADDGGE
jgi:hypothetical protein